MNARPMTIEEARVILSGSKADPRRPAALRVLRAWQRDEKQRHEAADLARFGTGHKAATTRETR